MTYRPLFLAAAALAFTPLLTVAQTPAAAPAAAPATAPATTAPAPAADAPAAAPTERPSSYTVESGDTLWSISHKFNTSIKALQKANNLKPHALLHPGQQLAIPPAKDSDKETSKESAK